MIADASLSSAFDDLADLFLGAPSPSLDGGQAVAGGGEPSPERSSNVSEGTGSHGRRNPDDGASPSATRRECGSTPALGGVKVELLVLGHLPVMGTLWAGQYMRMIAAQRGEPVALVRLGDQRVRVEVFSPSPAAGREGGVRTKGLGRDWLGTDARSSGSAVCTDVEQALHRAVATTGGAGGRVVVMLAHSIDEPLVVRHNAVGAVCLLTGGDDASAVAAYKSIKRLVADTGNGQGRDLAHVSVRVAVMGCDEQRARAAMHRLSDSARSFLGVSIEHVGHCRQIASGVPGVVLFDGPTAATPTALLDMLFSTQGSPRDVADTALARHVGPISTAIIGAPPEKCEVEHLVPVSTPLNEPDSGSGAGTPEAGMRPRVQPREVELDRTIEQAAIVAEAGRAAVPSAVLPCGLVTLGVRCPFDAAPVLAVTAEGHPAVVMHDASEDPSAAVGTLVAVAGWMMAHAPLLAAVCPSMSSDTVPVQMHLVTSRPAAARRLLDSAVRLHALASPQDAGKPLPLNHP